VLWWSSAVHHNAGLCGPLVSVGSVGTSYTNDGIVGTNLTNACPRILPCCDELRQNPAFCCIEARRPEFALSVCKECSTGE
jgi:hypothetical protein